MDRSTAARLGIAGAVAGLGLAAGGVALASADSNAPDDAPGWAAHPDGPRADRGPLVETLADELGISESKVKDALEAVRDEVRPERADRVRRTPPTEAERSKHQAALAKALAKELGISESRVTAALEVVEKKAEADRAEARKEHRADLVKRLDDAVEDGTLTSADKASVLKAFDAKLIGGFGGPPPR